MRFANYNSEMIFIPSAKLAGHRVQAASAKPYNRDLSKTHMGFGNRGVCRGVNVGPAACSRESRIISDDHIRLRAS